MTKEPKNKEYWQLAWFKFKIGDRNSFEEIYNEFVDQLYAYGAKITTDKELLKDCIHDIFLDLYRYNLKLKNPELLGFYLYKSLKRSIIKKIQKEKRLESIHPQYNSFELTFFSETEAFQDEGKTGLNESLARILKTLDEKKRELLFLKFESELSYNEIGDLLDMKPDTVKKQVYRILNYLHDKLGSKIMELFFLCCRT